MTIAHDASSPSKGVMQTNGSGKLNFNAGANGSTSNTFSPPANSLITVSVTGGFNTLGTEIPTNTGTALTWTRLGSTNAGNGGVPAWMFQAFNASAQSGIALKFTAGLTDGDTDGANTAEGEYWIDVWTGCNSNQTGQAVATGATTTTSGNVSLTSTQTGSQCLAIFGDFTGTFSSTDTFDPANGGGFAQMRAYKASNNGAPGTVNINFSGDTNAGASWVMAELLPAAAGGAVDIGASRQIAFPGLQIGTPVSRLRSGLEDTTPSPGPVGLPQGDTSVALPTTLRLGTPLSRLRSGFEDTTPSPGPIGLPQGEQSIQLPSLRLGTPLSRLRGFYSDVPPGAITTGVLNLFAGSASTAFLPLSGGIGLFGASASTAFIPSAGGVGAVAASASTASIAPAGGISTIGAAASAGIYALSGGIGGFGGSASTGRMDFSGSPGTLTFNGASASAAIYSALGIGLGSISLTGAAASASILSITFNIAPGYSAAPDFTGVHWYIASRNLVLASFNQTNPPIKVKSNRLPPGYVLYQSPVAGTIVPTGTNFQLTVVQDYLDSPAIGMYPWFDPTRLT